MPPCPKIINALPFVLWMLNWSSVQSAELGLARVLPTHPVQADMSLLALTQDTASARIYSGRGIVREVLPDAMTLVIQHEAISNFMAAMTMPFKVKAAAEINGLQRGDQITFRLHVAENESWVDNIAKTGTVSPRADDKSSPNAPPARPGPALLDCKFTNELGHAVSLNDFRGQALAITFFYTRCPLPDYCPRLSKNFQVASQKLATLPGAPTNWHFLSVTFDPAFDSPAMLKAYAQSYQYDPSHWSFLTGSAEKIAELTRRAGVNYELEDGAFNHDFRTLIVDAGGQLQMVFPTSGDLSDQIVAEMLKAAAATNQPRQADFGQ